MTFIRLLFVMRDSMKYLVTGAAGFIGFHMCEKLLLEGHSVIGIDNINDYYDVNLKVARLAILKVHSNFIFEKINLSDSDAVEMVFSKYRVSKVIHLGAQAGVRYSIQNPMAYIDSNIIGHLNILEGCRHNDIEHLIYASSSSVYGLNKKTPFSTNDSVDHPVSLYAATKKSNELMSHSYSHLYNIPTTGLRFFTVYGPWGRPDMALFKFTKAIYEGNNIDVYNHGLMSRDFTYIDDIIESIHRLLNVIPVKDNEWTVEDGLLSSSSAPYKIYNIGNSEPVMLLDYVDALEKRIGIKAKKNMLPLQPGDVLNTRADTEELYRDISFTPKTDIVQGIDRFVSWYNGYYCKA